MLYCIKNDIVYHGKRTITEIFYADEETARNNFNSSKGITAYSHEITLYEINTNGIGFTDPKSIGFDRFTPIDFAEVVISS